MRRPRRAALVCGLVIAGLAVASPAAASCSFNSTTSVSFSAYDVFSATDDSSTGGSVKITCTKADKYSVSLTAGGSGSFTTRKMTGPGGVLLDYNLYTTSAYTTVWGDGTSGTVDVTGTATANVAFTLTIFGLIPKNQYAAVAGTYTDSVTVAVTP